MAEPSEVLVKMVNICKSFGHVEVGSIIKWVEKIFKKKYGGKGPRSRN